MPEPFEDFESPARPDEPDVLRLVEASKGPIPPTERKVTGYPAPDLQLTNEPQPAGLPSGSVPYNPYVGPWFAATSREFGQQLDLVRRFTTYGPMGGNPWYESMLAHLPAHRPGGGALSPVANPYSGISANPYSQIGGGNTLLSQLTHPRSLYDMLNNGGQPSSRYRSSGGGQFNPFSGPFASYGNRPFV